MPPAADEIILAPFSNSELRDWPVDHWTRLIGLLLEGPLGATPIRIVGTPNQRLAACEIVRSHSATAVENSCGRLPWAEVVDRLRVARCVIGNNSGIPHLAAHLGRATVCIFGGSHQRAEWHPKGSGVVILSRVIGCSPCHFNHAGESPYDKACLREIEPPIVAEAATLAVARIESRGGRETP